MNVTVPAIGESVSSGMLASWLKKDGERVKAGEDLFELETDKANLTVPAPASGVLRTKAKEGTEVQVGEVVGTLETEASAGTSEAAAAPEVKTTELPETPEPSPEAAPAKAAPEGASAAQKPGGEGKPGEESAGRMPPLSPAARRIAAEEGLRPESIPGTGKNGRITGTDAIRAAEAGNRAQAGAPAEKAAEPLQPAPAPAPERKPAESVPAEGGRRQRRVPMTRIRQRIAENLVLSKQSSAHLTTFNEVDMSAVMELRSRFKDEFLEKHGTRLGFMSFFIRASCRALGQYPETNAFVDGTDILYNDHFDIGVALSTDRGLITPVVRGADRKSFASLEGEIVSFAERAKQKKITPDELSGATFTITNGGVFGSLLSTPIPSPPQTAILGMHAIQKRPVVIDDQIVIRPMMYVALTYDHRIIDGREAIGFLVAVKRAIEDPQRLLLEL